MGIFAAGPALNGTSTRYLKYGSGGQPVRDLQRALNAAIPGIDQPIDGLFYAVTSSTLKKYEKQVGLKAEGVVSPDVWAAIAAGQLAKPSPPTTCPTPSPTDTSSPTDSSSPSITVSISPTASTSPQPPTTCPTTSPTVITTTPAAKKPATKHAATKKSAPQKKAAKKR
jgi:peptidoglycan hydrolase-like protein with peptidoglycan-binding domain